MFCDVIIHLCFFQLSVHALCVDACVRMCVCLCVRVRVRVSKKTNTEISSTHVIDFQNKREYKYVLVFTSKLQCATHARMILYLLQ